MSNNRTLTSKQVRTGIKNGFTVKTFCTKYGIKGESNFIIQLEKAFPNGGSEQVLREIRKNEKNRKPGNAAKKPVVTTTTATKRKEGDVIVEEKNNVLEQLQSTESQLSSEVVDLENQHKVLAGERRICLQELRDIQQKVVEITAELENQQTLYEEIARKNNEIVKQMNQISETRHGKMEELTKIREQISALETTTIAVYEDGGIEVVDGNPISLFPDEAETTALSHHLMEDPLCENLTIKQIKLLARIIVISRSASKVEFIFDVPALEKAYLASLEPISA